MQPRLRSRAGAAVGVSLVALMLSACGSSGESKKDFVARANAICNNAVRDVRTVAAPSSGGAVTLPALAKYLGTVAPILVGEAKQLKALPRPGTDHELLRRYLAAVTATATQYKALADAARTGDRQAMSAATAALRTNQAGSLAARYGLHECSGASGTLQTSQ